MTADVLTYSDLTTDPHGRAIAPPARLAEIQERYGADSIVGRGVRSAAPTLMGIVARVEKRIDGLPIAS